MPVACPGWRRQPGFGWWERRDGRGAGTKDHPMTKSTITKSQRLQQLKQQGAGATQPKTGADSRSQGSKSHPRGKRDVALAQVPKRSGKARKTKQQICLGLLSRPDGATLEQLQRATGWQPHSVRGFLSGAVKKKLRLKLVSEKVEGEPRRYRIVSAGA
jgi:hypothetical protein